jgi:hypothetical protein
VTCDLGHVCKHCAENVCLGLDTWGGTDSDLQMFVDAFRESKREKQDRESMQEKQDTPQKVKGKPARKASVYQQPAVYSDILASMTVVSTIPSLVLLRSADSLLLSTRGRNAKKQ